MEAAKTLFDDHTVPLSLKKPVCSKRHVLRFISQVGDGSLLFESMKTNSVLHVDKFGFDGYGKQIVFNGTPDQFRVAPARGVFHPGDLVFIVRPFAKRRIFAAEVVRHDMDTRTVIVTVHDRQEFGVVKSRRQMSDGIAIPIAQVFRTPKDVDDWIEHSKRDFEKAQVERRQIVENRKKLTAH